MTRALTLAVAIAATVAGLWLYIDTHADRLAASTEGAHDWREL